MGENTAIEWADHSYNFWFGCQAIAPECKNCYAEAWAKRAGYDFSVRRLTSETTRNRAHRWQREAAAFASQHGRRQRVFVNSLSDWADNKAPQAWRDELFKTIRATPDLDYLLLTKRIGNVRRMLPKDWGYGYTNVWLGISVGSQRTANRDIPKLLSLPAVIRFLSCEPLLGPVDLTRIVLAKGTAAPGLQVDGHPVKHLNITLNALRGSESLKWRGLDWVIPGGESGGKARPSHPDWFRSLRDQCIAHGTPFLFKQWGEWAPGENNNGLPTRTERTATWFGGAWHFAQLTPRQSAEQHGDDEPDVYRLGKKQTGRKLDGRVWDEFPKVAA